MPIDSLLSLLKLFMIIKHFGIKIINFIANSASGLVTSLTKTRYMTVLVAKLKLQKNYSPKYQNLMIFSSIKTLIFE